MGSETPPPTMAVTHQRPRPGAAWWIGGALLVVAGAVVGGAVLVSVFVGMFRTEGELRSDGLPVAIALKADHDYLLWSEAEFPPECFVVDRTQGGLLPVHGLGDTRFSRNADEAFAWFDAGSGDVAVSCENVRGGDIEVHEVEVGPRPGPPDWIGGIDGAILVPVLLVLGGITVLVVTGVRSVRARRP